MGPILKGPILTGSLDDQLWTCLKGTYLKGQESTCFERRRGSLRPSWEASWLSLGSLGMLGGPETFQD